MGTSLGAYELNHVIKCIVIGIPLVLTVYLR